MNKEDIKIRDILLNQIASKNKKLSSVVAILFKVNIVEYSLFFTNVLKGFANNRIAFDELIDIVDGEFQGKYSAYNFFDNNTLFAYLKYLEVLLENLNSYSNLTPARISEAINSSVAHSIKYAGKNESGYYRVDKPFTLAYERTNDGKKYLPRKPLSNNAFIKKYNITPSQGYSEVKKYFANKNAKNTNSKISQEQTDREIIIYNYKGKNIELEIDSKNYYLDEQGGGVVSIKASGKEGTLFTTRTPDGKVYNGNLYDSDYNFVSDDSGEIFYPNATASRNEDKGLMESNPNGYRYTDDDQMTLF